ncbi:MAG: trypsin-like peptidase domain-containing protein [Verrucomicrobiota bacterium]
MIPCPCACILVLAALFAPVAASAAPGVAADLVRRYADAIVGVELVVTVKVKMGDREMPPREQRIEVNGTVVTPEGLTVTSLAGVDPQVQFDAMRAAGMGSRGAELVGADVQEVKLRLADGPELPARFVLKDADLDLAFMAPEEPAAGRKFPHVALGEAVQGDLLGTFYYVARASKALQRVPLVRSSEVMGVVEKPRRLYLLSEQAAGSPMFDAGGKLLGISLQHFANGRPTGTVVLPAGDIADIARQAAAAMAPR